MCLVVIVDDRATNRAIYSQLARSIGQDVEVVAFGDPEEALNWLSANRASLIVTDCDMPRIVGDEFISRFRSQPHSAGVPIMMVTVCDRRQLRLRALESGATDFLQAPVDHFEFLTRARNLLKLSRSVAAEAATATAPLAETRPVKAQPGQGDDFDDATRGLLERCAPAGYAFHVIEIAPTGAAAPDITAALRRHLRGADLAIRIDPLRYVLLQNHVAGPADSRALARRVIRARASFHGVAAFRIGSALPDAGAGGLSAAECLRDARRALREVWRIESDAPDLGALAPIVDLQTGALAGARLLKDGAPAQADAESLHAALACAAQRSLSGSGVFKVGLRLGFGDDSASDASRASRIISALKAFGVGLTLDLGRLAPDDRQAAALSLACGDNPGPGWRHTLILPCQDADGVEKARALLAEAARQSEPAPLLLADGVPSPNLLRSLRRAGVSRAQGPCFGAPFALRDVGALLGAGLGERAGAKADEIEARRA